MLPRLLFAALLLGHAVIHAGFVSPRPTATGGPTWPFALDHSWLLTRIGLDGSIGRGIGVALLLVLLAGYATAALATLGVLGPSAFAVGIAVGSGASILMLAVFFHPWLIVGVILDLILLGAVLGAGWRLEPLA